MPNKGIMPFLKMKDVSMYGSVWCVEGRQREERVNLYDAYNHAPILIGIPFECSSIVVPFYNTCNIFSSPFSFTISIIFTGS